MPVMPTLMLDLGAVVVILMIVISVGGWVINAVKKAKEAADKVRQRREAAMRDQRQAMHINGGRDDEVNVRMPLASPSASADAKLQELARRRQQAVEQARSQAARTGSTQPDNLTAAQKQARDRAREAYQRRAELLARQRQAQQQAARQSAPAQQPTAASQQRPPQQARPQPQASRSAAQPQASRPRVQPQQQAAPKRMAVAADMMVQTLRDEDVIQDPSRDPAQGAPGSRGASGRPAGSQAAAVLRQAMAGPSIRSAFLLKEVLDRPVALRDPAQQPGV